MPPETELSRLQSWLQAAMLAGADPAAGDDAAPEAVVIGSNRLTARARVDIYASGYMARLLEALRGEYPLLRQLAGDQVFDLFAGAYVRARPSGSYTLYDLGAGFADHLERTRPPPPEDADAEDGPTPDAIPACLARLERARAEVFRARGVEREPGLDGPMLPLLLMGTGLRLYRPDSLRLLELPFDLLTLVEAAERRQPLPMPEPGPVLVAVARAGWQVRCHRLEPWQFAFLSSLDGGEGAAPAGDGGVDAAPAGNGMLRSWLPRAFAAGFVTLRPPGG